ncbi:hypothetical protein QFZ77_000237 [Paenibacillus sp. V4I3]|uniref:DUF7737 domain-containing protein n=1 Tax=Paenibacillus sp. V4I3 TaxID=3042305 RepID=UPI002785144D|nr:hypothetical protein [Paenibacillus sp. V4I3]MDQ0871578.1 hypothetical protein [Paenibacillus sp. V4I3]
MGLLSSIPGIIFFENILPVHSQHRGKLFLPFMDEDPKTSEILSKIVMLAQDTKIKDPHILDQIKAVQHI